MNVLRGLSPVSEGYADLPIAEAFDWQADGSGLADGEWYLVAFRSTRKAGADEERLTTFDELAHLEAASSPGFVHYFKGPAARDGSCLSFCLWQTRADARAAAGRPDHVQAVSLINEMYESYTLEFHRVAREAGGPLTFAPYDRAPTHVLSSEPLALPEPTERLAPNLPVQPALAF